MLQAFEKLSLNSSEHYTRLSSSQLPDTLRNSGRIRKLDSLIITNFKSFKGKVYVGPLLSFTSIVGPNGAGKSNVLDALMFCFCNEKTKLTYFDIREFIQREGNQTYQDMADRGHLCEVQAKLLLEDGKELVLARSLDAMDQQNFYIDGESFPREAYEAFLMRCNINHRTVNYAIWQGEIDKLLLKEPKDLTMYLQDLSGSCYFRQEQQQVQQEIVQMDAKIQARSARLVKLKQDKKIIKNLNNFKAAKDKLYEQYENITQKLQILKAFLSEKAVKDLQKQLANRQNQEKQQIKTINQRKAKMQREQSQSIELEKKIQALMREEAEVHHQIKSYDQRNQIIDNQDAQELSRQIAGLESYLRGLESRRGDKKNEENSVQSSEISKEYLQLYGRWENENAAVKREFSKRRQQYLYLQGILQAKKNVFQQFNLKKQTQEKALVEDKNHIKQIEKSLVEIDKNIESLKKEALRLTNEGEKSRFRAEQVAAQLSKTNEQITDMEVILSDNSQSEREKQLLKKLIAVEGFRGVLSEWVKPVHRKYELCFQLMLGPLLKYLLCLNEPAARQVSLRLREDMQLRTVVILENVKEKKDQINRSELGKLGTPALEIVEMDKGITNLDRLLKQFLGGKVLCDNLNAAWVLLGKGVQGIREIYTLDGDVLRSDGVVSTLGSVEAAKNQYRYLNQPGNRTRLLEDIQKLQKVRMQLEAERDTLKKQYAETISKNRSDLSKLQTRREQLKLKQLNLTKVIQARSVVKVPTGLQKEIQELKKRSQALEAGMRDIERDMSRNPIFQDFLKSHKIEVGSFRNIEDLSSLESSTRLKFKIGRELQQIEHEMGKVQSQLKVKREKLQQIKSRLKDSKGKKELPQLQSRLKQLHIQIQELKVSLASLKASSTQNIRFVSEVPQLTARLNLFREQHQKLLKDEITDSSLRQMAANGDYQLLEDGPLKGNNQQLKKWWDQLQHQKSRLQNDLDQYSMNVTDVNQLQMTQEQLKQQTEQLTKQLKTLIEQKDVLVNKLSVVKKDRNRLLVQFLNQLRPVLSHSYRLLTSDAGLEARVDIHMQNPEFPCEAGLYYNPTPPGKRFVYDLDQLSGGEKSIASLALHYSIAVTSKSPLLVLDETDAFLDAANVNRFIRLVEHCVKERTMQFLVITHKRSLFLVGESLVGVTKPREHPFSKAYSLLLDEHTE